MDTNTTIIIIVVVLGLFAVREIIFGARVPEGAELTPDEFETKFKERGSILLDVRTAPEFSSGKIKGAKNISYPAAGFSENIGKMNRNGTYLVYCQSGSRSGRAETDEGDGL